MADLVGGEFGDVPAKELHLPGRGSIDSGDDIEDRRLSGPVGADEAAELPFLHFKVDLLQGLKVAKKSIDLDEF
jgi:hypothetical protein